MTLKQLKHSILDKHKVESKVKEFEIEKAKLQRQLSILSQEFDEENIQLNKLEKNPFLSFLSNRDNKILEQQELIRKIKRKYNNVKYNLDLIKIDLSKQTQYLQEIISNEQIYEQELEKQISLLKNEEYEQLKQENQHYLHTILQGEKIIERLKEIELNFTIGFGDVRKDINNLKDDIHIFEDPLNQINSLELKDDIALYTKYSKAFFENAFKSEIIAEVSIFKYKTDIFPELDTARFKLDVNDIVNKVKYVYEKNLAREKDLRKKLEEAILKAELL